MRAFVVDAIPYVVMVVGLFAAHYAKRSLEKATQGLDAGLKAFEAALVARADAVKARDEAIYERKAITGLLQETRRVMGESLRASEVKP